MKEFPSRPSGTPVEDILSRVELELTAAQLDSIRGRASSRQCSEEEYLCRLVGDAMLQNVLMMHLNFSKD